MTVTHETLGAYATGTASCTPGYPASPAAGDLLLMGTTCGNLNDIPVDTPPGFLPVPNSEWQSDQGGAYGTDTGKRTVKCFYRISDGTETGTVTVSNNGTGTTTRVTQAQITRFSKTAASWYISASGGVDNTSGTGYSVTAADVLVPASGDFGLAISGWIPDSATAGTPTLTWDGVANTCTASQSTASTQGADCRFLIYRRALAGVGGSAPVFATTASAAVTGATAFILIHDDASAVVEPDDASHAHTATSPTLTQHQVLAVNSASHAHTATEPTLTPIGGTPTVEPDDTAHTHGATSPTLTQHQVLAVDNAAHAHGATSPTLTQRHVLAVDNALHTHSATSPTLTQHHALGVDSATHAHAATSPTLTPSGLTATVEPDDATHAHAATSPTLTQRHVLTVASATHAHTATSPTVILPIPPPDTRISVAEASPRISSADPGARTSTSTAADRDSTSPADDRTSD